MGDGFASPVPGWRLASILPATAVACPRGGLLGAASVALLLPSASAGKNQQGKAPWRGPPRPPQTNDRSYVEFRAVTHHSAYSNLQWGELHPPREALPEWFREAWCEQAIFTVQPRLPTRDRPLFLLAYSAQTAVERFGHPCSGCRTKV